MANSPSAFIALYRWRLHPGSEEAFVRAWSRITQLLLEQRGSLGSRLHRGPDNIWYGYTQWPSAEAKAQGLARPSVDPEGWRQLREAIAESLPGLQVAVTVPLAVLEWFVEASDSSSGASVEDWCDYEGYDSTPAEQLDRDMADDVETFVGRLLSSELRMDKRGSSKVVLEWKIGNGWEQAIPLLASALNRCGNRK